MAFVVTHEGHGNNGKAGYPRPLTTFERDVLLWLLPSEKPGYRVYRELLGTWLVAAEGRQGAGNYILAAPGTNPDIDTPLSPVFAYGVIEADALHIGVTLREKLPQQMECEIANLAGSGIPGRFLERRRWTYSTWIPAMPCPKCSGAPRLVPMHRGSGGAVVLALCPADRRIWVYDESDGVNHLVPVTNFYNELMLHRRIRDPKIALDAQLLFSSLGEYSDGDLTAAFVAYNALRPKIDAADITLPAPVLPGGFKRMLSRLGL